jgi:hypothetical protein
MEILSEILLSPFGAVLIFLLVLFAIILVVKPRTEKKKSSLLLSFFHGTFSPLGTIQFPFAGTIFRISRIARGAGITNVGGSFPVLWAYVKPCPKFIIGNAESKKYTNGNFLILPPYEIVSTEGLDLLIGSKNKELLAYAKSLLSNDKALAQNLSALFQKDFAHITIAHEFHIGAPLFIKRKNVFRYICLPEEIYQTPAILESQLKIISDLISKLGITFE